MKKLFLIAALLCIPVLAQAEKLPEWFNKLDIKQGIGYSLNDSKLNSYTSFKLAGWKFLSLDAGVMGDADSTDWKGAMSLSASLLKLKDYIDIPVLDKVVFEPGVYFGVGRVDFKNLFEDTETDYGVTVKIISINW